MPNYSVTSMSVIYDLYDLSYKIDRVKHFIHHVTQIPSDVKYHEFTQRVENCFVGRKFMPVLYRQIASGYVRQLTTYCSESGCSLPPDVQELALKLSVIQNLVEFPPKPSKSGRKRALRRLRA